jgi:hypothetical protein
MVECNVSGVVDVQDFEVAKRCGHKMNVHIFVVDSTKA